MKQFILIPKHYSLKAVLLSHGWSGLDPFKVSKNYESIQFAFLGSGKPTNVEVSQKKNEVMVESGRKLSKTEIESIQYMFGLNISLDSFFDMAHQHDRAWIQKFHMGRLMRSETAFEDLIKLILTTNCTWSLTKKMVTDLCVNLGEKVDGNFCFPRPEVMAKKKEDYFKNTVKTGYRAPYISKISKMVDSGKLNVESWRTDQRPYTELRKEILALPGAGPYVAENLLRYLGKYDGLGIDSWVRGQLQKMWSTKKQPDDKAILKKYKQFENYKGLMLWCDVTRQWHMGTDTFE
jgi:3-methyladenine DNA glycosylase/8-oxoguanine DNA glycosylase